MIDAEDENVRRVIAAYAPAIDAIEERQRIRTAGNGERDADGGSERGKKRVALAGGERQIRLSSRR